MQVLRQVVPLEQATEFRQVVPLEKATELGLGHCTSLTDVVKILIRFEVVRVGSSNHKHVN